MRKNKIVPIYPRKFETKVQIPEKIFEKLTESKRVQILKSLPVRDFRSSPTHENTSLYRGISSEKESI